MTEIHSSGCSNNKTQCNLTAQQTASLLLIQNGISGTSHTREAARAQCKLYGLHQRRSDKFFYRVIKSQCEQTSVDLSGESYAKKELPEHNT